MKSVILFIKCFWKPIVFVLALGFIFSYIGISSCREHRATVQSEKANTAILRAYLIDSTQTAMHKANIAKLDSAKAAEAVKTEKYKANAEKFKQEAYGLRKFNNGLKSKLDSMLQSGTATCGEMLGASLEMNDSLRRECTKLDSALVEVDKEAQSYSERLYTCEQQSSEKTKIISEHEAYIQQLQTNIGNLQCYREWGNGHPVLKWLFGWKCK